MPTTPNNCVFDKIKAIPSYCQTTEPNTISMLYFANVGYPLELPAPVAGESDKSRLARAIAERLLATDDSRIVAKPIYKGVMPAGQPDDKLRPDTNQKFTVETLKKYEWTDYEAADEVIQWYRDHTGATELTNQPIPAICWAVAGKKLIGGLEGYVGNMSASQTVSDDANVALQIKAEFGYKMPHGDIPRSISLP